MSKNTGTSELINYFDLGVNGDVGISGNLTLDTITNATTDTDTFLVSDTGIIKYRTGAQLLSDIGAAPATGGSYLPLAGGTLTGTLNGTSAVFSGDIQSNTRLISSNGGQAIFITANSGGLTNRIEATSGLPLHIVTTGSSLSLAAGGTTPQFTLASTGAVTLTGALNGTSASFSGNGLFGGSTGGYAVANRGIIQVSGTSSALIGLGIGANNKGFIFTDGTNMIIANEGGAGTMTLQNNSIGWLSASSTGAATFSSNSNTTISNTFQNTNTTNASSRNYFNIIAGTNRISLYSLHSDNNYINTAYGDLYFQMNASTSTTNPMIIKSSGNVGIGTTSPSDKLHIANNGTGAYSAALWTNSNSTANLYVGVGGSAVLNTPLQNNAYVMNAAASGLAFGTSDAVRMFITSSGNVLIGTTTDNGARLHVSGVVNSRNASTSAGVSGQVTFIGAGEFMSTGTFAGYFWENRSGGVTNNSNWYGWYTTGGVIYLYNGAANIASINTSTGAYTALSDINKKKDFEQSTLGLNQILNLKPTLYRMNTDSQDMEKQLGFLAQEVKEFIPQAYVESEDFIGLNYNSIIPVLVNAIKELKQEIDTLKS